MQRKLTLRLDNALITAAKSPVPAHTPDSFLQMLDLLRP